MYSQEYFAPPFAQAKYSLPTNDKLEKINPTLFSSTGATNVLQCKAYNSTDFLSKHYMKGLQ